MESNPSSGASVTASSPQRPTEQEAIDAYLAPREDGKPVSILMAALLDAQAATHSQPPILWLATLGYLIVVEQIGQSLQPADVPLRRRSTGYADRFGDAAAEFGDPSVCPNPKKLYDLRCALAHEYGLNSNNTKFQYDFDPDQPLFRDTTNANDEARTVANLAKVWQYVEDLAENVRVQHGRGNLRLPDGVDPKEIMDQRFTVGT